MSVANETHVATVLPEAAQTSRIWAYYADNGDDTARCNLCERTVKRNSSKKASTLAMWVHLRRMHKDAGHSAVESGPYGSVNVASPAARSPKVKSPSSEARKPTVYSKEQLELLEGAYAESQYIEGEARSELSTRLNVPEERVQCWFRCRRYKDAQLLKKNTEANSERAVHASMALVPDDAGTPRSTTRITCRPDLESVRVLEDLDQAPVEPWLPSQTPEAAFEPKAVITASPSRNDRDSLFSPVGEVGQSLLVVTSSEPANDYGESDEGLDVALEPKDAVESSSLVAVQPSENATRSLSAFTSPFASSQQHGAFEALALPLPQPSPVYAAAPRTTPSEDLVDATGRVFVQRLQHLYAKNDKSFYRAFNDIGNILLTYELK